jgi:hypothetical protein
MIVEIVDAQQAFDGDPSMRCMALRAGKLKFFAVGVGIAEMAAAMFTTVIDGYFFSTFGLRPRSPNYLYMSATLPIVDEWFAIAPAIVRNIDASEHAAFDRCSRRAREEAEAETAKVP